MNQDMSVVEALRFLTEYRDVTHELHQKLLPATVEDVPLDEINELLLTRDRLIETLDSHPTALSAVKNHPLLAEIVQMESVISAKMNVLWNLTQNKIRNVQEQKRGANAYQNEYMANALFFDRKK